MIRSNPGLVARREVSLDPLVSERLDHIVKCIASVCVYQSYTDGSFKRQTMPCRSRRFVTLPRDSLPVHIPPMADRHFQHEENAVLNRVDHPVVTQAHSKPWPPAQRDGRGRSWVLSEQRDRALHATSLTRPDRSARGISTVGKWLRALAGPLPRQILAPPPPPTPTPLPPRSRSPSRALCVTREPSTGTDRELSRTVLGRSVSLPS